MEILIQPESRGIHYEGYENEYIQCVFEDGDVSGRNERYEFRCRPDLECCGRICCIPQEATVPFWLMILFIVLALLLLFALLGTIAWLCSKRKPKPKLPRPQKTPVYRHDIRGGVGASGYRSIRQQDGDELQSHRDRLHMESAYNTPADNVSIEAQRRGYGNPMYGTRGAANDTTYRRDFYDRGSGLYDKAGGADHSEVVVPIDSGPLQHSASGNHRRSRWNHSRSGSRSTLEEQLTPQMPHGGPPAGSGGDYYRETFEEKFEEKYEVEERTPSVSDSRELL
uniref:CX domain-containing protein n=1 Tax=Parascaris univalens TaxID=6257 RepID=A0A915C9T4_PARUN